MSTVFAHHSHVFPESLRPEGSVPRLQELLATCGIDEAVCFAPFSYQWEGEPQDGNGWLAKELESHDNLVGFGTLDLAAPSPGDQVRRIADLGFRGIKLHPAAQQFNILAPEALEAYERAQELGLFLSFHTGIHWHRIKDYNVKLFDEICYLFPDLRFSLEHVGGYHFFNEALAVIVNNFIDHDAPTPVSRVYGGLTSVFTLHMNRFWHLSDERILELVAQAGVHQIFFGLDFPYNRERETLMGLEKLRSLLTEDELSAVLGGNLRRALRLETGEAS